MQGGQNFDISIYQNVYWLLLGSFQNQYPRESDFIGIGLVGINLKQLNMMC
jgi:hypothetical protein